MANTKVVGSNTPKKRFFRILMVILIIGLCLLMLSPFIWMIGASFKKEADVMKQGNRTIPHLLVSSKLSTGTWFCRKNKLSLFTGLLEFHQGSCHLCVGSGNQQLPGRLCFCKTEIPRFQCTVFIISVTDDDSVPVDVDSEVRNFLCGRSCKYALGTDLTKSCGSKCYLYDASGILRNF